MLSIFPGNLHRAAVLTEGVFQDEKNGRPGPEEGDKGLCIIFL